MTVSTSSSRTRHVAILADSLARWTGGIDFLRLCVGGINSVSPETTWNVLLPSKSAQKTLVTLGKSGLKMLAGINNNPLPGILRSDLIDALTTSGARVNLIDYRDTSSGLASAMRQCCAEALLPCPISLGRSFPFPWIGYIPDLQHKRLAHWFRKRDSQGRDRIFSKILSEAPAVIVNSQSVIEDIKEFYPRHKARLFALPFCPPTGNLEFSDKSGSEIRAAYQLPARYFLISNQFWIHKSHETAFIALRRIRDAGHDVHLVCTGNTYDSRWPQYFNDLKDVIEEQDLRDCIRILGLVPKADQLAIMRESVAVIQPTLFEGGPGGGAVYDAVSTRTPSIVSDIPVNREIDIGDTRFFAAGSPEDLAEKMADVLIHPPQRLSGENTCEQLTARQKELGAPIDGYRESHGRPSSPKAVYGLARLRLVDVITQQGQFLTD
jgi:glycosyltransferase involved in cell wall biosynthesis